MTPGQSYSPPPGTPPPQGAAPAPAPASPPPSQPPAQTAPPSQPYQGAYGAPYQPPYQPAPPPAPIDPMMMLYIMAFLGIILALVGVVVSASAIKADSNDGYETMQVVGVSLEAAGMLIVAVGILMALMRSKQMTDQVRLGLLIALAIIIAWGL